MAIVTNHAKRRMHERVGITKGIADKMTAKVLRDGIKLKDTKGDLRNWMLWKNSTHHLHCQLRYYAGKLYIFNKETLITVLDAPDGTEDNLYRMVESSAYKAYKKSRKNKRSKDFDKKQKDKQLAKESEILDSLVKYVNENNFEIIVTSIKFIKPGVIRICYISNSNINDWERYTSLQDYVRKHFDVGSFLTKVRDENRKFITIDEWKSYKN